MENQYLKKIIAQTPEDLHIISACCSEGKVNIDDVKYLASNKIFLISIARFSKEEENKNRLINSIIKFEFINSSKSIFIRCLRQTFLARFQIYLTFGKKHILTTKFFLRGVYIVNCTAKIIFISSKKC